MTPYILQDRTKGLILTATLTNSGSPVPNFTLTFMSGFDSSVLATVNVVNPNGNETKVTVAALIDQNTVDTMNNGVWWNGFVTFSGMPGGVSVDSSEVLSTYDAWGGIAGTYGVFRDPDGTSIWCATWVFSGTIMQKYDLASRAFLDFWCFPFQNGYSAPTGVSDGTAVFFQDSDSNLYALTSESSFSDSATVPQRLHKVDKTTKLELGALGYDQLHPDPGGTFPNLIYGAVDWCVFTASGVDYVSFASANGFLHIINLTAMTLVGSFDIFSTFAQNPKGTFKDDSGNIYFGCDSNTTHDAYIYKWNGTTSGTVGADPQLSLTLMSTVAGADFQSGSPTFHNAYFWRYVGGTGGDNVIISDFSTGEQGYGGDLALIEISTGNQVAFVSAAEPSPITEDIDSAYAGFRDNKTLAPDPGVLTTIGDTLLSFTPPQLGGVLNFFDPNTLAITSSKNVTNISALGLNKSQAPQYTYIGVWDSGTNYNVGDIVTGSDGAVYVAITTSGPSDTQGLGVFDPAARTFSPNARVTNWFNWAGLPAFIQGINRGSRNPSYPTIGGYAYDVTTNSIVTGYDFVGSTAVMVVLTPQNFNKIAWSHGLDFGADPTRTDVATGNPYAYPPTLTFPHVVPGTGVVSLLEDPPVYFQVWSSSILYPAGAIAVSSAAYYQALRNTSGEDPASTPTAWKVYAGGFSDGLTSVRDYCHAYSVFASCYMDAQRPGKDWLDSLCQVTNCVAVWTGSVLRFYPLCEVSAMGGGYVYTAPTAPGPIATVDDKWYVVKGAEAPVKVVQQNMQSVYNQVDINYADQNSGSASPGATVAGYNQNNVSICDQQHAFRYGTMVGAPLGLDAFLVNPKVATSVGWPVLKRQRFMDPFHFQFKVPVNFSLLDPMDLITLVEPGLFGGETVAATPPYTTGGSGKQDVRIFSMSESADGEWSIEAERFIYGAHAPSAPSVATYQPVIGGNPLADGGSVNIPYIFEPTAALAGTPNSLWIAVSGSSPDYGGCQVLISTDGGSSYSFLGAVNGNPNMGYLTADYPDSASPDSVDTLSVDLTESEGTLQSWTSAQQAARVPIALLSGGGTVTSGGYTLTVPYEVVAYEVANLTAAHRYDLSPTILRGQAGTPTADHPVSLSPPASTVFVDLSSTKSVFKGLIPASAAVAGTVLWFKFPTYNTFMSGLQDSADCVAYPFTVTLAANAAQSGNAIYTVAPSPCLYQGKTGGWIGIDGSSSTWSDPTKIYFPSVTANFTSGAAVYLADDSGSAAFSSSAGGETRYVTIYDPNKLGGSQPTHVDATNANAVTPGYTYLGQITSAAWHTGTGTGGGGTGGTGGSGGTGGPTSTGGTVAMRKTVTFTTPSMADSATDVGFANLFKMAGLISIQASAASRVVLYASAAAQAADAGRPTTMEPTVAGVLFDATISDTATYTATPGTLLFNDDAAGVSPSIYWSVANQSGGSAAITVSLTIIAYE